MLHVIVSVRDSAIDAYMRPFAVPAAGAAIRSFQDEINRAGPDNVMSSHPADYVLYELGQFDDQTGRLTSHDAPRQLIRGSDVSPS